MSKSRLGAPAFVLLAIAALSVAGCAGHSDFMTKAPGATGGFAPLRDVATVVFIRDSGLAFAVNFSVVDHAGNLLGDAVAKAHFALQVPPGRYFFFARGGENTDAVQADLASDRTYYVRVVPQMGWWLARVELDPVKPNEQEWASLPVWLADTERLEPLIPKAAAQVPQSGLPDWAAKAWSALSPRDQSAHTLSPQDGLSTNPLIAPPAQLQLTSRVH